MDKTFKELAILMIGIPLLLFGFITIISLMDAVPKYLDNINNSTCSSRQIDVK